MMKFIKNRWRLYSFNAYMSPCYSGNSHDRRVFKRMLLRWERDRHNFTDRSKA